MDDINWNDWLNRKEITIDDALWLSMPTPIKPPGTCFPETSLFDDEYKERREIAESWRKEGQLQGKIKLEEDDRDWYIKPLTFFRLARDIEWLNPLNSEHDPIFIFLETMDKTEREISEKAHIQLLTDILKESPKLLDSGWIAELWAAIPGESYENKPFWKIRDDYKNQIESAVIGGELEAVVEIREHGFDDGFKELTDKNRIRKVRDGLLNGNIVRFTICREQFQEWLKKSKQWPVPCSCLLISWFSSGQQVEAFINDEVDYRDEPLNENALYEIDFEYWAEQAAAQNPRSEWLKKLKLDVKVKEIEKACQRAISSGVHSEQISAYSNLAALTSRGERYFEGADTILLTKLSNPNCFEERIRLCVWRYILKAAEIPLATEEFQIIRNEKLLKKLAEIDALLENESGRPAPKTEAVGNAGACISMRSQAINSSPDIYTQRKNSFNSWLESSGIDIQPIIKKTIFSQIKSGCNQNDKSLWEIKYTAFEREFWQRYSKEHGIKKKRGRPTKKI